MPLRHPGRAAPRARSRGPEPGLRGGAVCPAPRLSRGLRAPSAVPRAPQRLAPPGVSPQGAHDGAGPAHLVGATGATQSSALWRVRLDAVQSQVVSLAHSLGRSLGRGGGGRPRAGLVVGAGPVGGRGRGSRPPGSGVVGAGGSATRAPL